MRNPRIGFIGAGKLGMALAMALTEIGFYVTAVTSRSHSSSQQLAQMVPGCQSVETPTELANGCDLAFITTPDDVIRQITSSTKWKSTQAVVHCCGALSLDVLDSAASDGASVGSIHPFQTFSCLNTPKESVDRLTGVTYAVEGKGWVEQFLLQIVAHFGGTAIQVSSEDRAIYHASAVLIGGLLTGLLNASAELWQEIGYPPQQAYPAIATLSSATIKNVVSAGARQGATGPVVRGDIVTVTNHLEALETRMPSLIPLYCTLGMATLRIFQTGDYDGKRNCLETLLAKYLARHSQANQT